MAKCLEMLPCVFLPLPSFPPPKRTALPLKGRVFKIQKNIYAVLSQIASGGVIRNFVTGGHGAAPERGSYSRIGACPYLSPQLINSRCCPCKGRISLAGLAPQQDSRYEPLTGARFINRPQKVGASPYPKYEPLSGAPLYQPFFFWILNSLRQRCPAADFSATKGKKKGVHQRELWCTPLLLMYRT